MEQNNRIHTTIFMLMVVATMYAQDHIGGRMYVLAPYGKIEHIDNSRIFLLLYDDSVFTYMSQAWMIDEISYGRWTQRNDTLLLNSDRQYITHPKMLFSGKIDYFIHWAQFNDLALTLQPDSSLVCYPYAGAESRRIRRRDKSIDTRVKSQMVERYQEGEKVPIYVYGEVDVHSIPWIFCVAKDTMRSKEISQKVLSILGK